MIKKVLCYMAMGFMLLWGIACDGAAEEEQAGWETGLLGKSQTGNMLTLTGGKVLEGLTVVGEDDEFYCNLEGNMRCKMNEEYQVLVCKDPVYDITYYVNYGRDYYIYAIRDGISELVVELPGRELFCKEGELYFIADTYGIYTFDTDTLASGNIIKYNPVNGSLAIVVDKTATAMIVYPDGICYNYIGEAAVYNEEIGLKSMDVEYYYYSFADKSVTTLPEGVAGIRRWKKYYFRPELEVLPESDPTTQQMRALGYTGEVFAPTAVSLVDREGRVAGTLKNEKAFSAYQMIYENKSYDIIMKEDTSGQQRSVLTSYDFETGERNEVVTLDYPTIFSTDDMLLYKDTLYFGNMLRVSLKGETQCYVQYEGDSVGAIDAFYTDGERIFCLHNEKLWKLEEKQEVPMMVKEFIAGTPLEIGNYVYSFLEP